MPAWLCDCAAAAALLCACTAPSHCHRAAEGPLGWLAARHSLQCRTLTPLLHPSAAAHPATTTPSSVANATTVAPAGWATKATPAPAEIIAAWGQRPQLVLAVGKVAAISKPAVSRHPARAQLGLRAPEHQDHKQSACLRPCWPSTPAVACNKRLALMAGIAHLGILCCATKAPATAWAWPSASAIKGAPGLVGEGTVHAASCSRC